MKQQKKMAMEKERINRKEGERGRRCNTSENIAAKLATIVASQWEAPLMKNGNQQRMTARWTYTNEGRH